MSSSPDRVGSPVAPSDQLRLLIEAQTDYAIFLLDPGGRVASWNPGAQRIKGYTAEEIVGHHFSRFYTQADIDRGHPPNELEIAKARGSYEEEGWRVRKDGSRFWAHVVITALRDDDGRLVGFGKVTHDLTERRAAEEQLQAASRELAEAERRSRIEADRMRRRATALEDVGRAIVASSDLEEIVQIATDAATDLTGATFGVFSYTDFRSDSGVSRTLHSTSGESGQSFLRLLSQDPGGLGSAAAGARRIRTDDITADPRFGHLASDASEPVRSFMAVPVTTSDADVTGVLFLGNPASSAFGPEDEETAASIAASAAVALVNAKLWSNTRREAHARQVALDERDHVARVLQRSLLPPELPQIPRIDIGSHYGPGVELVGGDFYDVFALSDDRWGVVLGDVCGIGPEAASLTALTRHSVRTAAMFDPDPTLVLETLNRALIRSAHNQFVTAVFATFDLGMQTGDVSVSFASGGHPPPILCRRDGTLIECHARGPLLGIIDDVTLESVPLRLSPGDCLVFYTDGLVEARRGKEVFGYARLRNAIYERRGMLAAEHAAGLAAAAEEFASAELDDDVAIVVMRLRASGGDDGFTPYPATDDAPGLARHDLVARLGDKGLDETTVGDAALVLTEFAANAIRHAGTSFAVKIELEPSLLRITVRDGQQLSPDQVLPVEPLHGLALVDAVAASWGSAQEVNGKVVWAELPLS